MGGISLKVYLIMGGHILNTSNSIPTLINASIRSDQILYGMLEIVPLKNLKTSKISFVFIRRFFRVLILILLDVIISWSCLNFTQG